MPYRKIGTIENIDEIEIDKNIIVNGKVDKSGWMWHMPGQFTLKGDDLVFVNEIGAYTKVEYSEISLTVLEKCS